MYCLAVMDMTRAIQFLRYVANGGELTILSMRITFRVDRTNRTLTQLNPECPPAQDMELIKRKFAAVGYSIVANGVVYGTRKQA